MTFVIPSLTVGLTGTLSGAVVVAERHGYGRVVGSWLADALLAQRLGRTYAVPLPGTEAMRVPVVRGGRNWGGEQTDKKTCWPRRRALDLSAELGRRADGLLAVAPRLRAKART